MSKDPVCGMQVKEEGAPKSEFQGASYFFCCNGCKETFDKDPSRFVKSGAAATAPKR